MNRIISNEITFFVAQSALFSFSSMDFLQIATCLTHAGCKEN